MHVEAEVAVFASCGAGGGDAPVAGCGVAGGLGGHSASWNLVDIFINHIGAAN